MTVSYTSRIVNSPAWDAGASLIEPLTGDGAYSFTVGQCIGIVCGLSAVDSDVFYGGIAHAFWVETGRCKVVELGSAKTGFFTVTPATVFTITRVDSVVRYYIDDTLRYTSIIPSSGTVFLDCSLYAYGDTITTVSLTDYDGRGTLVFPSLVGEGGEPGLGWGLLQIPSLTGFGEVTDGRLTCLPLLGAGFEADGMGEGWLPALTGTGEAADGVGTFAFSPLAGFGVEDGVSYGYGVLAALDGAGFEIYDKPEFNQGWFALRALYGVGAGYPDIDGDGVLYIHLHGRGTDTDLVGGLTFPTMEMSGAVQFGTYFNIQIGLNLRSIVYNHVYDRVLITDTAQAVYATGLTDRVYCTETISSASVTISASADTVYARDRLNTYYDQCTADIVVASESFANEFTVDSSAVAGWLVASDEADSWMVITDARADTVYTRDLELAVYTPLVWADSITLSDAIESPFVLSGVVTDFVLVTELRGSDVVNAIGEDLVTATDAPSAEYTVEVANTATLTDATNSPLGLINATEDTLLATDLVGYSEQVDGTLADTAVASEESTGNIHYLAEVLTDTGLGSDSVAAAYGYFASLADTTTSTDVASGTIAVYGAISTTVVGTDVPVSALALVGVLSDTVLAGDTITAETQTIYLVNADTGAVSTYTFTPTVTGAATHHGTLYLAGPAGLYAVDTTTDPGSAAVVWTVKTGFNTLGTDHFKRIQDVNLQARLEGDTTLQVTSDRNGTKKQWTYRLPATTRTSYRDGVVKVGKGLTSVYWQFGLQGTSAAEIDHLKVTVEPLSRRR